MNRDQVKGKLKEASGKAQQQAGKLTGDRHREAKGHARELEGKTQKKAGDVVEGTREILKKP